jgi:Domain of unknown function (DUF4149)
MRTTLRALIFLLIVFWLGGVMFFPVVAWAAFSSLSDTHAAGTIVAKSLRTLHYEGLFTGSALLLLLVAAQRARAFSRQVLAPILLTLVMLGLTAYSQFSVIARMEADRIRVGGAIDAAPANDPSRIDFNRLHQRSETVEEGVMLAGILEVVALAWAAQAARPTA